ncbi:MAG: type I glutamate--ammonia ligase [Magnetococcales bacterium]|nr:type I glutamate--ammonia ligase [Magnetococcales bacterium]|tara:strand:+ start:495056 stop:496459 length:1404 start_codon:yes stop_codon:yes gene_type:complete
MTSPKEVFKLIENEGIEFVGFRFTDFDGQTHQLTIPARDLSEEAFTKGTNFDGSSIPGWRPINRSDMMFRADASSYFIDPFTAHSTVVIFCDIVDPDSGEPYNKDPRSIAMRAEQYLTDSGIGDTAYFGPELEFFIFDNVLYKNNHHESMYHIDASNGTWNTGNKLEEGNTGHVPGIKGSYFATAPLDRLHDVRSEICKVLDRCGIESQLHHAEVATGGQCEVGAKFNTAKVKADEVQMFKYIVHNVCDMYGKTATFMPKPIAGDNGSGMHVHQSIWKKKTNVFAGDAYDGLSEDALYYIGGIIKHAKALNAFTNPSTNSYKRLIPGFEAPVILAYGRHNRSASIRIPAVNSSAAKRIETRFPDCMANPYLAFSAMLMAGLDGIKNKIHPGDAQVEDLYEESDHGLPEVCGTLEEALNALDNDRDFLKEGGVFDDKTIDSYIELKRQEVMRLNHAPHPVEFEMYYGR